MLFIDVHLYLLVLFKPLMAAHFFCSNITCPTNYAAYTLLSPRVYKSGTCISQYIWEEWKKFSRVQCASRCLITDCLHVISGDDGCVLVGVGVLTLPNSGHFGPLNKVSWYLNVSTRKPVTASSIGSPPGPSYDWGPQNANDGIYSEARNYFSSKDDGSDPTPYLLIDLGQSYYLSHINLLPRWEWAVRQQSLSRAENVTIYVGSTNVTDGNFAGIYQNLRFIRNATVNASAEFFDWTVTSAFSSNCGRYLAVKKDTAPEKSEDQPLEISEINVYTRNLPRT